MRRKTLMTREIFNNSNVTDKVEHNDYYQLTTLHSHTKFDEGNHQRYLELCGLKCEYYNKEQRTQVMIEGIEYHNLTVKFRK